MDDKLISKGSLKKYTCVKVIENFSAYKLSKYLGWFALLGLDCHVNGEAKFVVREMTN